MTCIRCCIMHAPTVHLQSANQKITYPESGNKIAHPSNKMHELFYLFSCVVLVYKNSYNILQYVRADRDLLHRKISKMSN